MTTDSRVIFDVDDIRGIRLECGRCHTTLSIPIDQTVRVAHTCPNCGETWGGNHTTTTAVIADLVEALKTVLRLQRDLKPPVRIRFEIDEPPA